MSDPRWDDLRVRVASGGIMAVLGLCAVALGGVWFQMLTVFVTAVMVWELWMMIAPEAPTPGMLLAAGVASVLSGLLTAPGITLLPLIFVPAALGLWVVPRERRTFAAFALAIMSMLKKSLLRGSFDEVVESLVRPPLAKGDIPALSKKALKHLDGCSTAG